jgi:hypothetical protein
MSPEKSRFVYRCAFFVEILLAIIFIVLSGFALQQKTILGEIVCLLAIPSGILAMFIATIALATAKDRCNAFFPIALAMLMMLGELMALRKDFDYLDPLLFILLVSSWDLVISFVALRAEAETSNEQYTALEGISTFIMVHRN